MKILDQYYVSFKGKPTTYKGTRQFTIQTDSGERFDVDIPDYDHLITAFRWLSDNDCLRHLRSVAPSFVDNEKEIVDIMDDNAQKEEHAYLTGSLVKNYSAAGMTHHVMNLTPVPDYEYTCTWTFYSKEHAVMFKLACGGDL